MKTLLKKNLKKTFSTYEDKFSRFQMVAWLSDVRTVALNFKKPTRNVEKYSETNDETFISFKNSQSDKS